MKFYEIPHRKPQPVDHETGLGSVNRIDEWRWKAHDPGIFLPENFGESPFVSMTKLFLLPSIALGMAAHSAQAQTVQYGNFQTGAFNPSLNAAYFALSKTEQITLGGLGNFGVTIATTGTGWGTKGSFPAPPTGVAIGPASIDPAFQGSLAGLNVLALYGAAGNTITLTFNFSTLAGGVLPAGSILAYNDVDGTEGAVFSTAATNWYSLSAGNFYQGGTNVGSPWGTTQPSPGPGDIPLTTGSTTTNLVLTGPGRTTDGVTNFIVTQRDLTSLTITATGSAGEQFAQAFAIGVIPEPSALLLVASAGVLGIFRRQRQG
jgi:hypothetical protein